MHSYSMARSAALSILIIGYYFGANAQSIEDQALNRLLDAYHSNKQAMGTMAISIADSQVYHYSFGYYNLEKREIADTSSKYLIGSVTKTFTSTLIMLLVEEETLSLDQILGDLLPDYRMPRPVTIQQLLLHTSGITDQAFFDWTYRGKEMKLKPGVHYANANYGLLGLIIEKATGKAYAQVLDEHICQPLLLTHTSYGRDSSQGESYYRTKDRWRGPFHLVTHWRQAELELWPPHQRTSTASLLLYLRAKSCMKRRFN